MSSILITGANGFLGQHLCLFLKNADYEVIATGKGESRLADTSIQYVPAELTNSQSVHKLVKQCNAGVIIHSAALSKPDECENNRQLCTDINVNATKHLLQAGCSHFIYLSTDFVFGESGPHSEDEKPAPLNFYGESKLMAEQAVLQSSNHATIVRPVFMYGKTWQGIKPTFLHWVKNNLEQQKPIKVVSDQWRTPTYVQDICQGIETIIDKGTQGIYHLAGKDILSPYEMAIHTANVLGLNASLVEKVTADTFPEPVKRAKRSGLKIDKAVAELGYNPLSFEEGVRKTFQV